MGSVGLRSRPETMGLSPLTNVGFIFVLCSAAAALDIRPEVGKVIRTGWIEYPKTNNRLPQCCGPSSVDCSMVRIQSKLIEAVKDSEQLRFTMSGIQGELNLIVSYDAKLDGLVGKVYKKSGEVYTITPTPLSERAKEPCYVGRLSSSMNSYHRLNFHRVSDGDVPKILFKASADKPRSRSCCIGTFCHSVSEFNLYALKGNPSGFYDLYVPRHGAPSTDVDEMFAQTAPEGCSSSSSLCDVYFYKNAKNEVLRIALNGNSVDKITIDANHGAPNLLLQRCNGGEYIWSENPQQKRFAGPATGGLQSDYDNLLDTRADPGPACWFPEDYCDTLHYAVRWKVMDMTGKTTDELIMECYEFYQQHNDTRYFTYLYMRDRAECHLLSDCFKKNDDICIERRGCVSGPTDCGPLPDNANCTSPPDLGPNYNKWQCIDKKTHKLGPVQPLSDLLPGTVCLQSCGAWKALPKPGQPQRTGYLESTCQNSGEWTATTTINSDGVLAFPAGPTYPLPDYTLSDTPLPLSCGCEDLPLLYNSAVYNPSDEEGADFACTTPLDTSGLITIETGNACYLWCDGVLAITVMCNEDGWTGSPDLGIWCYEPPMV